MITQELLMKFARMREQRLREEKDLKYRFREEEDLKRKITAALSDGLEVETGGYIAEMVPQGRFPDWKIEFVSVAGENAADEVLAKTPYRMILAVRESME